MSTDFSQARRYRVRHTTKYLYPQDVSYGQNVGYLVPLNQPGQERLAWRLQVDPPIPDYQIYTDYLGNEVLYFAVERPHLYLAVTAESEVRLTPVAAPTQDMPWVQARQQLATQAAYVRQFCFSSPHIPYPDICHALAQAAFPSTHTGLIAGCQHLMQLIYQDFCYQPHATQVDTPLDEVMRTRQGVCQDFAHVAIAALRSLGLAAAYVSGYLETLPPPGQAKLVGADASHAWFSLWVPHYGWLDFDPTNNIQPQGQHIWVARGRDFSEVTPLKGVYLGLGIPELQVAVDVQRIE